MFFYTVRRYKRLFSDLHLRLLIDEWRVFNCYKLLQTQCRNDTIKPTRTRFFSFLAKT